MPLTLFQWFCIFDIILIKSHTMISPYVFVGLTSTPITVSDPTDLFNKLLRLLSIELFIDPEKVNTSIRKREYVECRQMIAFTLRQKYNMTCVNVGRLLGNRHHTTIVHNTNMHQNDYKLCASYREIYDRVCKHLL